MRSSGFAIDLPRTFIQTRWLACILLPTFFFSGTFRSDFTDAWIGIVSGGGRGGSVHRFENGTILLRIGENPA